MSDPFVEAALVGAAVAPPTGTDADRLLVAREDGPAWGTLLAAGCRSLLVDAAAPPPLPPAAALPPADPDGRPVVPPRVLPRLATLRRLDAATLPAAYGAIADAGFRLPASALPSALTACPADAKPALARLAGPTGRWLGALNRSWAWTREQEAAVEGVDLQQAWQEGDAGARKAALRAQRRVDPAAARAWLEADWTTEKADRRAALLAVLAEGLSAADQPFLQAAVDGDRSKQVRAVAADLLASLPDSPLARRMARRAEGLLVVEKAAVKRRSILDAFRKGGGRKTVVLSPPESIADGTGDGLDPKAWRSFGPLTAWAVDVLSRVPPSVHLQALGMTPGELTAAVDADEHAILVGLSAAAVRFDDGVLAGALWARWRELAEGKTAGRLGEQAARWLPQLVPLLPPEQLELRARKSLKRASVGDDVAWVSLLPHWRGEWPEELALLWLQGLQRQLGQVLSGSRPGPVADAWRRSLADAAWRLPTTVAGRLASSLPRPADSLASGRAWNHDLDVMTEIVALRAALASPESAP